MIVVGGEAKRRACVTFIALVAVGLGIPVIIHRRSETLKRLQQCYREIPTAGVASPSNPL
jgi:hypothetical protein